MKCWDANKKICGLDLPSFSSRFSVFLWFVRRYMKPRKTLFYLYPCLMCTANLQPLYHSDESFSKCLQDGCVNENAVDRVDVLALVAEKTGNKTIRYWAGANFSLVLIMARTHFNHPLMYLRATEPEYCLSWWLEHLDCDQHSKRIYDTNYSKLTPHDRNKFSSSAYDWFKQRKLEMINKSGRIMWECN